MSARSLILSLLVFLGAVSSAAVDAQSPPAVVRGIHPLIPRPFELVNLQVSNPDCLTALGPVRVDQVSGELHVRFFDFEAAFVAPICPLTVQNHEIRLGAFPEGTYTVDIAYAGSGSSRVAAQRFTFRVQAPPGENAASSPVPYMDYSGHWWNPDESGWGMTITQSASGQLFAAFFAYDSQGAPTWYVAPGGTWENPNYWRGTLYRTSGPPFASFLGGTFDPGDVVRTPVGTLWLQFGGLVTHFESPDFEAGRATWRIDGVEAARPIRRMRF